jgi:Uma2 family endonuclease
MTQALEHFAPTLVPAKVTLEQYHLMVEAGVWDDCHVELLNGVIVEMPSEGSPHASRSTTTSEYLRDVLGRQVQIRDGHPITLPSGSEPEPDIAIVQRVADNDLSHHPYPEDIFWLIEYFTEASTKT